MPLIGVFRHVVVAESDTLGARNRTRGLSPMAGPHGVPLGLGRPALPARRNLSEDFETLEDTAMGVAGSPETVRRYIAATVEQTGISYFVCDIVFGSLPYGAAARSVDLFAKEVMPAFR